MQNSGAAGGSGLVIVSYLTGMFDPPAGAPLLFGGGVTVA
jgi:hypothetical protein